MGSVVVVVLAGAAVTVVVLAGAVVAVAPVGSAVSPWDEGASEATVTECDEPPQAASATIPTNEAQETIRMVGHRRPVVPDSRARRHIRGH